MQIILASQSPRRRALLEQVGCRSFVVRPAQGDEIIDPTLTPAQLVESLSLQKAQEVAQSAQRDDIIIAADTVVAIQNQVLGKPQDENDAIKTLRKLSGQTHTVYTGVTVCRGDTVLTQHEATHVTFRSLREEEIAAYIATGEPMDKAGSYGIQGIGALFVNKIEGDYFNVVGLPLCRLGQMLRTVEVDLIAAPLQKESPL